MNNSLSKVIVGTWPLSGDFGKVSLCEVEQCLLKAYNAGIEEFDVAPNYGKSFMEIAVGKVFQGEEVLINTKAGNLPYGGKSFSPGDLRKSLDESLIRLKRDQVNVFYLHNPRNEITNYDPILNMFSDLKKEGKITYSGISLAKNFSYPEEVLEAVDFIQEDINLLQMDILENKKLHGKLVARSPLASGILGGHICSSTVFPPDDHRSGWLKGDRLKSILKRVQSLQEISDISIDKLARRFLLANTAIHKVIFGVKRIEHIEPIVQDTQATLALNIVHRIEKLYQCDFGLVDEKHLSY